MLLLALCLRPQTVTAQPTRAWLLLAAVVLLWVSGCSWPSATTPDLFAPRACAAPRGCRCSAVAVGVWQVQAGRQTSGRPVSRATEPRRYRADASIGESLVMWLITLCMSRDPAAHLVP